MLESGESGSITELAAAERIDRSYLCRVLRLALLAPEIVEAILDGRQADAVTLPKLMKGFAVEWETQTLYRGVTSPAPTESRINSDKPSGPSSFFDLSG